MLIKAKRLLENVESEASNPIREFLHYIFRIKDINEENDITPKELSDVVVETFRDLEEMSKDGLRRYFFAELVKMYKSGKLNTSTIISHIKTIVEKDFYLEFFKEFQKNKI